MSSETKYTPGPLRIDDCDIIADHPEHGALVVAEMTCSDDGDPDRAALIEAYALLFAATPETLAALEKLTEWAEAFHDAKYRPPLVYVEAARAALRKARGE